MNNKIKIGVIVGILVAGLYLLPAIMNVKAQSEQVNGIARVNFDYVLAQDPVTYNLTGNSNVAFFNITGGATYPLVRAVVPIDIKPTLNDANRQKEYGRQVKAWALQNTIFNVTKVVFYNSNTIDV